MNVARCGNDKAGERATCKELTAREIRRDQIQKHIPGIIDHKVILLSVAGAAVHADCEPCLDEIVAELEEAGVSKADIRTAVKSGQLLGTYAELGADVLKGVCERTREYERDCAGK